MPMQPPDVIMPVNENVRPTLGEYGEKLTGPLMFHERLGPEGKSTISSDTSRPSRSGRGAQIAICAKL
jgi:hypothetical protein